MMTVQLFSALTPWRESSEIREYFEDVFCGSGGYFQVPLQEIEKLKKSRLRTKNENRRGATRIRSDNLPTCPNVRNRHFKFHEFPSEVTCQYPPSPQKGFRNNC